jgi:hypothetical protein
VTDEITLILPRRRPFYRIAHLVLGGLAVRLDLTFEHLEDLQLALAGVLDRPDEDGEVTVTVRVEGDTIHTFVGPFRSARLREELERSPGDELSLRRLLDTVCDTVTLEQRGEGQWIRLTKTVEAVAH